MEASHFRAQCYVLLVVVLLLNTCGQAQDNSDSNSGAQQIQDGVLAVPVGGESFIVTTRKFLVNSAVIPWIKNNLRLVAKATISTFLVAEILAYLGVIGDQGEGVIRWAVEKHKDELKMDIRKYGLRPGGFLRVRLENLLTGFANLPDRTQFVTCVSIGATVFPLLLKTILITSMVTLVSFTLAGFLSVVGILREPGEGLSEFIEESEPLIKSWERWASQTRMKLRKKLQLGELFRGVWGTLRNDRVFWTGLGIGAGASLVLDNDVNSSAQAVNG